MKEFFIVAVVFVGYLLYKQYHNPCPPGYSWMTGDPREPKGCVPPGIDIAL